MSDSAQASLEGEGDGEAEGEGHSEAAGEGHCEAEGEGHCEAEGEGHVTVRCLSSTLSASQQKIQRRFKLAGGQGGGERVESAARGVER
eukprot:42099-Rhodomonas_salina.1